MLNKQERFEMEYECAQYCSRKAIGHLNRGNFGKAQAYWQNAARSARELQRMDKKDQQINNMWLRHKQTQHDLLSKEDRILSAMQLGARK